MPHPRTGLRNFEDAGAFKLTCQDRSISICNLPNTQYQIEIIKQTRGDKGIQKVLNLTKEFSAESEWHRVLEELDQGGELYWKMMKHTYPPTRGMAPQARCRVHTGGNWLNPI